MKWLIVLSAVAVLGMSAADSNAQSAKSSLKDPVQAQMFNDISGHLVCQCGCNMILRVCNHFNCPSAVPMRAEIETQILAGMDEKQIIASFVDEYGLVVMATPPPTGFNLAAWIMPGFFVLLGAFVVVYFLSDWLGRKKARGEATPVPIDSAMQVRIEEELKRIDG